MKRVVFLVMILGLFTFLSGCQSDHKQASEIHGKMEESASFEEKFVENQKELDINRKRVQEIYHDVLSLDSNDTDSIKQRVGDHEISKEKQQLNEAEENFQTAFSKLMSIDENIELIKDADQKKQATKLMTLMNNRKKLMEKFFDTYRDQLNSQTTFFGNLEQGKFELNTLEDEIDAINEDSIHMSEVVEQINQVTEQYNKVMNDYFKMADIS
ncbi:Putative cell-wall binding lipoprotein [Lysinibacillus sphaericus]|nr:Putative cell-wall binding lipoprotein [Lysinibacillus sphaericus]